MPDTIPEMLAQAATRDATKIWLRTDGDTATFGQATAQVAGTVERLAAAGVRPGDLVLMTARTTPTYLVAWLAITSMGAVAVTADPDLSQAELTGLLGQVRPRLALTDDALTNAVVAAGADEAAELGVGRVEDLVDRGGYPAAGAGDLRSPRSSRPVGPDNLATLIPTSGTTGRSKLVMQTHRAYAMAGEGFPYWMELTADDRLMTSLPLFHINAVAYSTMGSLACGAGLVLLPRFSASGFLDSARRHGATEFNAIGAMLEILMRQPERPDDADTRLRLVYTGPSPTQERQEEIEARFGLRIVCGYAMSESPYGLIWPRGGRPYATLGSLRQHPTKGTVNFGKVVDDDGLEVAFGEVGELLLNNPVVTPGYWQMPDETDAAIVDGWLHTGDLVTVDAEGIYTFVARKKEVLRRRGQNLSPAEVEDAVLEHPDVVECAVVGVPSELSEDDIKAFVVVAAASTVDFGELRTWAAERLTAFKVPRFWQVVDALPRTPTARVAKHRLPTGHPPGEYDAESADQPQAANQAANQAARSARTMTGYPTSIGTSDATSITLLGKDLADDLLGKVGFTELAYWLLTMRRPTPGQLTVFDAVLVALADHGFTPTAIAARLTLLSAPESLQGALAAGLLGGGSRYLGVTEDCGRFLDAALAAERERTGSLPVDDAGFDAVARRAVQAERTAGRLVPGLGHPVHKDGDPRTPALIGISDAAGLRGPYLLLFEAVGRVAPEILGRALPLNGAGVCGAALCDAGVPVEMLRGVALLARTAGLLGHLAEEMRRPIGAEVYHQVVQATDYLPPD